MVNIQVASSSTGTVDGEGRSRRNMSKDMLASPNGLEFGSNGVRT
jgi:hypothetical protein